MRFRGGEFSTGTMGNFQPELTQWLSERAKGPFDPERVDLVLINKMLKWTVQDLRRHAPSG